MSKMFRTHQNTIGNLAIALLFVGGCIFLLTGSWDAPETEAGNSSCRKNTMAQGCCRGTNTSNIADPNLDCDCLGASDNCSECLEAPDPANCCGGGGIFPDNTDCSTDANYCQDLSAWCTAGTAPSCNAECEGAN